MDAPPAAPTDPGPGASRLVYVGVDEAGYGPMLGPLCVGLAAFEVSRWDAGSGKPPSLWSALRAAVAKDLSGAAGRLVINDSKRVKLANAVREDGRHPLVHLERGVLAFLECCAPLERWTDEALLASLGAALEPWEWYGGEALGLPVSGAPEQTRIAANRLRAALERAGVRPLALRVRAVGEGAFNERCDRLGSKAAVSFEAVGGFVREAWERWARVEPGSAPGGPRIVVDRQGGRACYGEALRRAAPGAEVAVSAETDRVSRYELRGRGSDGAPRAMTVAFQVEAEQSHLPVALASMAAKLVRELAMERFNRHFCGRSPGLAPTAGYFADARRWLDEAAPVLTPDERRALVRRR